MKNHVNCLPENLLKLLNSRQMKASELAKNLNLPYNTIHRLLTGVTIDPCVHTLKQIANYFDVSLDSLLSETNPSLDSLVTNTYQIPILSWRTAINFALGFKKQLEDHKKKFVSLPKIDNVQDLQRLFALKATKSMQPRFPLNTFFIINLDETPKDCDLIIIRFKDNSLSAKELVIDKSNWQLQSIMSRSNSIPFKEKEHELVGVVILIITQSRP